MKRTSSEQVDDVPVVIKWLSEMQIEAGSMSSLHAIALSREQEAEWLADVIR